jgi:signal transduction histidine kinase
MTIFMLAFAAEAFLLTSDAYDFSRRRERENGIREQGVILSAIAGRIANAETFYPDVSHNDERLIAVMRPLADYYRRQGVRLALFDGGREVYADIPNVDKGLMDFEIAQSKKTMEETVYDKRHVLVSSQLPDHPHLTFVYARDISQIDEFRAYAGRMFSSMIGIVFGVLSLSISTLLKRATKPITELTAVTAEIAGGAYGKRISVNRSDEFGALADSFNRMADSVEGHMARLVKAAEEKQQFIDDLTHEMRTPLTSILGYSEYLKNAKSTQEERITAAGHLHRMALRLNDLSDKLSQLTLLRGGGIALQPVDVRELFEALADMTSSELAARGLELDTISNITHITGDETLLLSMLRNLVENSARASKSGAVITVRAYEEADPVIEVADTGCGMERRETEKITAPFYRVDKSRSRGLGGAGLGLSIVSQIAGLHRAKIEIASAPDEGTTVRICFTTS